MLNWWYKVVMGSVGWCLVLEYDKGGCVGGVRRWEWWVLRAKGEGMMLFMEV